MIHPLFESILNSHLSRTHLNSCSQDEREQLFHEYDQEQEALKQWAADLGKKPAPQENEEVWAALEKRLQIEQAFNRR